MESLRNKRVLVEFDKVTHADGSTTNSAVFGTLLELSDLGVIIACDDGITRFLQLSRVCTLQTA